MPTAGEPHVQRAGHPAPKPRPPAVLQRHLGGAQSYIIYWVIIVFIKCICQENMNICAQCRRTPCTTCWIPRPRSGSPTSAPGRCAIFQHILDHYCIVIRIYRDSGHVCPLQENPVYHVLETLRPNNLVRPQWESFVGAWEVRKLSTYIGLFLYYILYIRRIKTCVLTAGEPRVPRAGNPAPTVGVLQRHLGGAQNVNIYWVIIVLYYVYIKRFLKHGCPLQENPVYNVLETPLPKLDRPQWESYNGAWEVCKLSTYY